MAQPTVTELADLQQPAPGDGLGCSPQEMSTAGQHAQTTSNSLKRFCKWVWSFALPGIGMFQEAYFIFSVGNVKPIWEEQYPECWKDNIGCSKTFLESLNFSQVAGLFLGMVVLGFSVDRIGRKRGSISTAVIMLIGGILLTVAKGPSPHSLFLFLIIAQTVLGFGVGGEFPVAASSASERAESTEKLKALRGQTVVLVFSMQAWGNIANLCILLFFLAVLGQTSAPYDSAKLSITWRIQYGFGTLIIFGMLYHRWFHLKESAVWEEDQRKKHSQIAAGKTEKERLKLTAKHYWHRLLGTSLGWFAWDFYYYGNKLFQSTFISIIQPGSDLIGLLQFNLLNSTVALAGYYFAAFTIDRPWMGRRRMQIMGFGWVFALFIICGAAFPQLVASPGRLRVFQALSGLQYYCIGRKGQKNDECNAMCAGSSPETLTALYYLSSFWGQFGPNATTFLLASELFPTDTRGKAHGVSAAVGKLGALAADILLGKVGDRAKFYWCAGAGALGVVVTLLFIPEITELDLKEGDRRWEALKAGRTEAYCGEAVNPKNLSWYEGVRRVGRHYDERGGGTPDPVSLVTAPSSVGNTEAQKRHGQVSV